MGTMRTVFLSFLLLLDLHHNGVTAAIPNAAVNSNGANPSDPLSGSASSKVEAISWVLLGFFENQQQQDEAAAVLSARVHFECFVGDSGVAEKKKSDDGDDDDTHASSFLLEACCAACARAWNDATAVERKQQKYYHEDNIQSQCLRHAARIPQVPTTATTNGSSSRGDNQATVSFFYHPNSRTTASASDRFQPPLLPLNDSSTFVANTTTHHFIWDDHDRSGRWLSDKKRSHLQQSWNRLFRRKMPLERLNPSSSGVSNSSTAFVADMHSILHETGGMHRILTSEIQVSVPQQQHQLLQTNENSNELNDDYQQYRLSLWIRLYLPADLFINVEDVLEVVPPPSSMSQEQQKGDPPAAVWLSLHTVDSDTVINEEEPAFVSPAHVVLVHVQATSKIKRSDDSKGGNHWSIRFDSKVHLRYPQPISEHEKGDFVLVTMLPPQLVAGELELLSATAYNNKKELEDHGDHELGNSTPVLQTWILADDDHYQQQHELRHPALLQTWAAAGYQEDDWPTVVVVMVAALVGMAVMLRDMARVAVYLARNDNSSKNKHHSMKGMNSVQRRIAAAEEKISVGKSPF